MPELDYHSGWAHPRSRGENSLDIVNPEFTAGSSPLTRGKLPDARLDRERGGLIPAHAGKTRARGQGGGRPGAHPRSRGENKRGLTWLRPTAGSSPLTRGKRSNPRTGRSPRRLIPAHAGKTWPGSSRVIDIAAHPRSRGENAGDLVTHKGASGSSPLTRGKLMPREIDIKTVGLIPAHAGKTDDIVQVHVGLEAHPRSRGENLRGRRGATTLPGSSPLTRGKHLPAHWLAAYAGLIPAHAGKTTCPPGSSVATSAHPRSRGENSATKPR